jgi:hypothetical protein
MPLNYWQNTLILIPIRIFTMTKKFLYSIGLCALALSACSPIDAEIREVSAERIARPAFMVERKASADGMSFQLWERMHQRGAPVNIYIEGDGYSQAHHEWIGGDPSPSNPVALNLASRDNSKNLIHIARPCQYMESQNEKVCKEAYYKNRRFSPEVLAAYSDLIDEAKRKWEFTDINLIGYEGGANIAAALAASRNDVVSLRTVAGILNPPMVYKNTKETLDNDSVLATAFAPSLSKMPQHHFIGAGDTYVPAGVYHTFRQAMGESDCVHYSFVQDADHERGWVDRWPELLNSSLSCKDGRAQPNGYNASDVFVPTTPLPPVPTVLEKP